MNKKVRVLIVDDSALMRQMLTAILREDPNIDVVGVAADPYIAREEIKLLKPDVLTLDVEMPGMDGITFLEKLMRLHPMPVVMVSSLTARGADTTLKALELGAVDFVTKPRAGDGGSMEEIIVEIREKVRAAATAHLRAPPPRHPALRPVSPAIVPPLTPCTDCVVVMGASVGGTQAIMEIMERLPPQAPGLVIVQHMPMKFTGYFAERLNKQCAIEVREARDGDRIRNGIALIAPGGRHAAVKRDMEGLMVSVFDGEPVNLHRPSVDTLFNSVAECAGRNALGIILTGMGADGARGIQAMRKAGSYTIAQDEESCVVFGMPDQAIRRGGICAVHPLDDMAAAITRWAGHYGANKKSFG